MPQKPTAFLSYRRQPSDDLARFIYDKLQARNADVFFDREAINGGRFAAIIEREIISRDYFLVILAPDTLESEWVQREIATALRHADRVKIIPVTVGFSLGRVDLPEEIAELAEYDAILYEREYADASIERIAKAIGLAETLTSRTDPTRSTNIEQNIGAMSGGTVIGSQVNVGAKAPLPPEPMPQNSPIPLKTIIGGIATLITIVLAALALFSEEWRNDAFYKLGLYTATPTVAAVIAPSNTPTGIPVIPTDTHTPAPVTDTTVPPSGTPSPIIPASDTPTPTPTFTPTVTPTNLPSGEANLRLFMTRESFTLVVDEAANLNGLQFRVVAATGTRTEIKCVQQVSRNVGYVMAHRLYWSITMRLPLRSLILLIILCVVGDLSVFAQQTETPALSPTPSPTTIPVTLHLLTDVDTLTLYIASPENLLLAGLELRILDSAGDAQTITIPALFDILKLADSYAQPGSCFVLRLVGTDSPLPGTCSQPNRVFRRDIARADVFWYDALRSEPRDIIVMNNGTLVTSCPAALPNCPIQWYVPLPPSAATPTPGDSPTAVLSPTPGNVPILSLAAACDGGDAVFYVSNTGAALLHSVIWDGYYNGKYLLGGTIQPIASGIMNSFFWRFENTDSGETRITLRPIEGIIFANDSAAITCPQGLSVPMVLPTSVEVVKEYPCSATVVSPGGSASVLLNIVRSLPRSNAPLQNSIEWGSDVRIQRKITESGSMQAWYEIYDAHETRLGWIPVEFTTLSESCPP